MNSILLKIKTLFDGSGFKKTEEMLNGTKKKVDALGHSFQIQGKTIGRLEDGIKRYQEAIRNSHRTDHIQKYNQLIEASERRINSLRGSVDRFGGRSRSVFGAVFGANLLMSGISAAKRGVVSFLNESETAYKDQTVAIAQLGQVMKNTMGDGELDVKDVTKFIEQQEKLGVVSKNAQLAGSKELATYITKKDSLKQLIPVMNDMLAHQNGINATQTDAQNVAMMMGKVLDGQVGALSRAGYRFDEAQEKILKYGKESERVAVLAEVVQASVGNVNEALAATPEGQIKRAALEYGEMQNRVGELATKIKGEAAQTFQKFAVTMWENRHAIVNVAKAVAIATSAVAGYRAGVTLNNLALKRGITLTAAKTAAKRLFTGQVKLATLATQAFNVASKATPLGIGIGLVAAAASAFAIFRKRTKENTEAMQRAKDVAGSYYSQERMGLDMMFAKLKQTNPKSKERNELVNKLKEMYPELNAQMETEIRNTNNLSAAYDTLLAGIRKRTMIKAKESLLEGLHEKQQGVDDIAQQATEHEIKMRSLLEKDLDSSKIFAKIRKELVEKGSYTVKLEHNMGYSTTTYTVEQEAIDREAEINKILHQITNMIGTGVSDGTGGAGGSDDKVSDSITGGGKQVKNFYISIDNIIGSNTNQFNSSSDNPATAQDFMSRLAEALQRVVNDVNYAAN